MYLFYIYLLVFFFFFTFHLYCSVCVIIVFAAESHVRLVFIACRVTGFRLAGLVSERTTT